MEPRVIPTASADVPAARRSRPLWAAGLRLAAQAAAGFVVGIGLFNYVVMPLLLGHGDDLQVPDVVGRPLAGARHVLEAEGLRVGHVVEQWSGDYPDGLVTDQDPPAMSRVKAGREVRLTVSIGSKGQEVPDLTGTDAREAQVRLARGGLRAGRIALAQSETVDKNAVIATDPPARSRVEAGSRVDLLVSMGPRPVTYLLPDLRGRHVDEVRSLLERAGIRTTARSRDARAAAPGEILEQQPPPGYRIRSGDLLELVVASGRGDWR